MTPQNSRYFNHNGGKYRISAKGGALQVFETWNRSPLFTLLTPAFGLIPDQVVDEAREMLGTRPANHPEERTTNKELALYFEVHTETIRNKVMNDSWTISERAMLNGETVDEPRDFYRLLYLAMYRKEITKKMLSEMMGICAATAIVKTNDETFTKAERYFIIKNIL